MGLDPALLLGQRDAVIGQEQPGERLERRLGQLARELDDAPRVATPCHRYCRSTARAARRCVDQLVAKAESATTSRHARHARDVDDGPRARGDRRAEPAADVSVCSSRHARQRRHESLRGASSSSASRAGACSTSRPCASAAHSWLIAAPGRTSAAAVAAISGRRRATYLPSPGQDAQDAAPRARSTRRDARAAGPRRGRRRRRAPGVREHEALGHRERADRRRCCTRSAAARQAFRRCSAFGIVSSITPVDARRISVGTSPAASTVRGWPTCSPRYSTVRLRTPGAGNVEAAGQR